jgi:hypothetical protein
LDGGLVSVAQERCVMWNGLSQQYERMSLKDQRTFDHWISANAIFGAIVAFGILAMAAAGFNAPAPDAAISASPKASNVVAADLERRADRSLIHIKGGMGPKP